MGCCGIQEKYISKFDIMTDTDDIIDFNLREKGIELLKKYDVEI